LKPLKLLIVGFDGGSWTVLDPLIRDGRVPTIARVAAGARGVLESTTPPVTPPAWTSFMTGKNPGKHGLYHFVEPVPGSYAVRYTNSRSRKARTIWSRLSDAGCRVGVVNVPMTYPPEPVNGFMISGMDTPDETSDFVHPRELVDEIRRAVGPIKLDVRYLGFMNSDQRRQKVLQELAEIDEQRVQMVLHLLEREPVEALMVLYGSPDTSQHYFWHYWDRSHYRYDPAGARVFGTAIQEVYERLDRHLARLVEHLADDGVVILLSDHGFGPTSSKVIHINRYLAELGLLTFKESRRSGTHQVLASAVKHLDRLLRSTLNPHQKRRIARLFPGLRRRWEASLTGAEAIDWSRTKAYCNEALASSSTIWLNVKGRQPEGIVHPGDEYRELVQFLIDRLRALRDPKTGAPLVERVLPRDEVYHGPYVDAAPDLFLAWWEGAGFSVKATRADDPSEPVVVENTGGTGEVEWTGTHRMAGILAVDGAGVRRGTTLEKASIIDLAPTILHLLGQPVPDDMDGRVLTEIFESAYLEQRPVRQEAVGGAEATAEAGATYSDEESEIIEKRLQDLGYIE
jgi:predicted AlkP superfamily phosphohydrolase/phosphomutase